MKDSTGSKSLSFGEVVVRWLPLAVCAGLPISLAPLALLFFGKEILGDYGIATALVAIFVIGELVGSLTLGVLVRSSTLRGRLLIGYALGALAFAMIGLFGGSLPVFAFVGAFVGGMAPASSPGTLQAFLLSQVRDEQVPRVLILARTQSTLTFMAGPAIAGAFALLGIAWALPFAAAAPLAVAAIVVLTMQTTSVLPPRKQSTRVALAAVTHVWPIYAVGFSATFVVGLVEMVVPALFEERGADAGWAGAVASLFFASGLVGTLLYGIKSTWRVPLAVQGVLVALWIVISLSIAAWSPTPLVIAIGVVASGLGVAILLTIRTVSLRRLLPSELHAAAFSINYAMSCTSYLACALIGGLALLRGSATSALAIGAGTVLVLSVIGGAFEYSHERKLRGVVHA